MLFDMHVFVHEGILDSSKDDFEDGDEVYEAIGEVLHEVADKPEIEVRSVNVHSHLLPFYYIHGMFINLFERIFTSVEKVERG